MNNLKKILVPTDFSAESDNAIRYCAQVVSDDIIEVLLFHVGRSEGSIEHFNHQKELLQSNSSAKVSFATKEGELIDTIIEKQAEVKADLIIMGTKGSFDENRTNTSRLVIEADCPVLAVPEAFNDVAMNNIALALGKDEIDDSFALGVLHDLARKFDAKVHILSVCKDDKDGDSTRNEDVLEYYLETIDYHYAFPVNSDIEVGIADYIAEKDIDLLAILPRNHARKTDPSEGRLTELLTLHTKLPLLTID